MTPCPVEESPFSKANTGTVRFQTHFVEFLSTRSGLRCLKTTPKCGMTHHLQISSSQLAAGVVRTDSIWEMSVQNITAEKGSRPFDNALATPIHTLQ